MKKCSTLLISLFFSASVFLCAQEQDSNEEAVTLTLQEAVDYALENSKQFKSYDIDLAIKKRASDTAWNVLLPTVQASATLSRSNDITQTLNSANSSINLSNQVLGALSNLPGASPYTPVPTLTEKESLHWAAVGNISISWNLSLAYIHQIKASKKSYESGLITWEQSQKQTVLNIKKLFYGLLLQQENLKIQRQTLENARQRSIQASANFRNGRVPEITLLQAQVTYENQRPAVEEAEQTFEQQLDMFAFLLGMPDDTKIQLSGSIEPTFIEADADTLIQKYGSNSLDIKALETNLSIMELNLKALNLSCYTPALSLSWGFQPVLSNIFDTDWFDSDNWTDGGALSITLAWNLTNLLPWSSTRQQAKDLEANMENLKISLQTLKENQRLDVKKSVDTLNQAKRQIESSQRTLTLAQRSYNMSAISYRNGTTELLDLRDAESQLNQAQLGLANQKFNYLSALLDLEYTLNTSLLE